MVLMLRKTRSIKRLYEMKGEQVMSHIALCLES